MKGLPLPPLHKVRLKRPERFRNCPNTAGRIFEAGFAKGIALMWHY